jgi:hypothetical protein
LRHTRKQERRKGGIEPRNKALRLWRTVRPGGADRPHGPRGPSGLLPLTVRTHTADRPTLRRGPSEKANRTSRDDPEKQTVRGEHEDCPPGTRGLSARYTWTVRNFAQRKIKATTDRNKRRVRTGRTPDEQGQCGLSAWSSRTVREVQTEQKRHDPESQLPQIIIGFPKR